MPKKLTDIQLFKPDRSAQITLDESLYKLTVPQFNEILGGVTQVKLTLPAASRLATEGNLNQGQILKFTYDDSTIAEYRIVDRTREYSGQQPFTLTAQPLIQDLATSTIRKSYGGHIRASAAFYQQTFTDIMNSLLTSDYNCPDYFELGNVPASFDERLYDKNFNATYFMTAIKKLTADAGGEWGVSYDTLRDIYKIDFYESGELGGGKKEADSRTIGIKPGNGNQLQMQRKDSSETFFSRIVPLSGQKNTVQTMGAARWNVKSKNASSITLSDDAIAKDGYGLIEDETVYFGNTKEGWVEITATQAPQTLLVASSPSGISYGYFKRGVNKKDTVFLEDSDAVNEIGIIEKKYNRPDIGPFSNLVENAGISPALSHWESGEPVGWDSLGAATISKTANDLYVRYGAYAAKVQADKGDGLQSIAINVDPQELSPYFSLQTYLQCPAGMVKVEILDSNGDVHPTDAVAKTNSNTTIGISIGGEKLPAGDCKIKFIAIEDNTTFYVDAVSFTNSGSPQPYQPLMGPRALWMEAGKYLRHYGGDKPDVWSGKIMDRAFSETSAKEIKIGSWVKVQEDWNGSSFDTEKTMRVIGLQYSDKQIKGRQQKQVKMASARSDASQFFQENFLSKNSQQAAVSVGHIPNQGLYNRAEQQRINSELDNKGLSKAEADSYYLNEISNLADLPDKSAARQNIDLGHSDDVTFRGGRFTDLLRGKWLRTDTGKLLAPIDFVLRNAGDSDYRNLTAKNIYPVETAGSQNFVSGPLGAGTRWDMDAGNGVTYFEADSAFLRTELKTHLFSKNTTQVMNGSFLVSGSAQVADDAYIQDTSDTIKLSATNTDATFNQGTMLEITNKHDTGADGLVLVGGVDSSHHHKLGDSSWTFVGGLEADKTYTFSLHYEVLQYNGTKNAPHNYPSKFLMLAHVTTNGGDYAHLPDFTVNSTSGDTSVTFTVPANCDGVRVYAGGNSNESKATEIIWSNIKLQKHVPASGLIINNVQITLGSKATSGQTNGKDWNVWNIAYVQNGGHIYKGDIAGRVSGGYMLADASSQYSPFWDLYDGVQDWEDYYSVDKLKGRRGLLDGLTIAGIDELDGSQQGLYGDYIENLFAYGRYFKLGDFVEFDEKNEIARIGKGDAIIKYHNGYVNLGNDVVLDWGNVSQGIYDNFKGAARNFFPRRQGVWPTVLALQLWDIKFSETRLDPGDLITISAYIRKANPNSRGARINAWITFDGSYPKWDHYDQAIRTSFGGDTNWERISVTDRIDNRAERMLIRIGNEQLSPSPDPDAKMAQLEKGHLTPWTNNKVFDYADIPGVNSTNVPSYIKSSKITHTKIESPTLVGNNIYVYGDLTVLSGGQAHSSNNSWYLSDNYAKLANFNVYENIITSDNGNLQLRSDGTLNSYGPNSHIQGNIVAHSMALHESGTYKDVIFHSSTSNNEIGKSGDYLTITVGGQTYGIPLYDMQLTRPPAPSIGHITEHGSGAFFYITFDWGNVAGVDSYIVIDDSGHKLGQTTSTSMDIYRYARGDGQVCLKVASVANGVHSGWLERCITL